MAWHDIYPHEIKATVVLYCGIVVNYKIGNRGFEDYWFNKGVTTKQKTFIAHNDNEHNRIFQLDAKKFIKQWPVSKRILKHLDFEPFKLYEEE